MKIYLAGPMSPVAERGAMAPWRQTVIQACSRMSDLKLLCPEVEGCDHTGINPLFTVLEDLNLLSDADAVLAYLDSPERVGTCVEIGYAVGLCKPVVLVVDDWVHIRPLRETAHHCPCSMEQQDFGWPWFVEAASTAVCILKADDRFDIQDEYRFWNGAVEKAIAAVATRMRPMFRDA